MLLCHHCLGSILVKEGLLPQLDESEGREFLDRIEAEQKNAAKVNVAEHSKG